MRIVSLVAVIVLMGVFCGVVYCQEAKPEAEAGKAEEVKLATAEVDEAEKTKPKKEGNPFDWSKLLTPSVPLFVALGGALTWMIKSRHEQLQAAQERLHADRRKLYVDVLSPFIRILTEMSQSSETEDLGDQASSAGALDILSYDYRRTAFEVIMVGSDEVIRAYNAISQDAFRQAKEKEANPEAKTNPVSVIPLWGRLLLEIRKSLGNKKTKLKESEALRWMLTDIDSYVDEEGDWLDSVLD